MAEALSTASAALAGVRPVLSTTTLVCRAFALTTGAARAHLAEAPEGAAAAAPLGAAFATVAALASGAAAAGASTAVRRRHLHSIPAIKARYCPYTQN